MYTFSANMARVASLSDTPSHSWVASVILTWKQSLRWNDGFEGFHVCCGLRLIVTLFMNSKLRAAKKVKHQTPGVECQFILTLNWNDYSPLMSPPFFKGGRGWAYSIINVCIFHPIPYNDFFFHTLATHGGICITLTHYFNNTWWKSACAGVTS